MPIQKVRHSEGNLSNMKHKSSGFSEVVLKDRCECLINNLFCISGLHNYLTSFLLNDRPQH